MDTTQAITHISLCAGYGGIDLGLRGAIPNLRTVAFSEIEAFACANLVAKMEAGHLDCAPIWTDLKTFPWGAFRDRVDILSGGYPCQPFSAAGKRLGTDDPRHLWPFIADGIRLLRPRLCFFENVEGHISLGLREVISELESMGYAVSWGIFSAREVGAPHQRKRVFILAMADNGGEGLQWNISRLLVQSRRQVPSGSVGSCGRSSGDWELADTDSAGSGQDWESGESRSDCIEQSSVIEGRSESGEIQKMSLWPSRPGQPQYGFEPPRVVANSNSTQPSEGRGDNGEVPKVSSREWTDECAALSGGEGEPRREVVGNADRRTSTEGRINDAEAGSAGEIMGKTASIRSHRGRKNGNWEQSKMFGARLEHMGDTAGRLQHQTNASRKNGRWATNSKISNSNWDGQAEPEMGGDVDGTPRGLDYAELCVSCDNRTDELRLLGNGVVPATATLAFQTLLAELLTL